jgi:hypothetical protein
MKTVVIDNNGDCDLAGSPMGRDQPWFWPVTVIGRPGPAPASSLARSGCDQ